MLKDTNNLSKFYFLNLCNTDNTYQKIVDLINIRFFSGKNIAVAVAVRILSLTVCEEQTANGRVFSNQNFALALGYLKMSTEYVNFRN